jgi:hypothetical protein
MKVDLEISCCLCSDHHKEQLDLPDGWRSRYDFVYIEDGFCPKHSIVEEWAHSQCCGCVGSWGDCSLWSSFSSNYHFALTKADLHLIELGICPKRTNGSFTFSREEGLNATDLSDPASSASGKVFAQAIREYVAKYLKPEKSEH